MDAGKLPYPASVGADYRYPCRNRIQDWNWTAFVQARDNQIINLLVKFGGFVPVAQHLARPTGAKSQNFITFIHHILD